MLIILEGCDLAGKTTYAARLLDEFHNLGMYNVKVLHKGPLKRHPLEEYELDLVDYRPNTDQHIICDRWHVGELIYGPIIRGHSELDMAMFLHVEMFLDTRGATQIHVFCDADELLRRYDKRGDTYISRDQIQRIHDEYIIHYSTHNVCGLGDSDSLPPAMIIEHAQAHDEHRIHMADVHSTYVGSREPDVVFLGDKRHNDDHTYPSAFVPFANTSGHWLLRVLNPFDRMTNESFGLMNACEDSDTLTRSWSALGQPWVIALGRNASDAATKAGLRHSAVPHPQYMRRFHNGAWLEYIELLYRARWLEEDCISWRP